MATPLDDWCKMWLQQARAPADPMLPDFARAIVTPPTVDQITIAVQLRCEWLERFKTCGSTLKQQDLRRNLRAVSQWLETVRLLVPLQRPGSATQGERSTLARSPARTQQSPAGSQRMTAHGQVMASIRTDADRRAAEAKSKRNALNKVLQQHVLDDIPWVEPSWSKDISDSFAFYLMETAEYLCKRLGPKLFLPGHFNLHALRAARIVAEDYWRAMIPKIDFGNDLAHVIEHFEGRVENQLEALLGDLPARWLPFIFDAALDGIGAERYAEAMRLHLDIIMTAGSRKATFVQLRDRNVHNHYDLMTYAASRPSPSAS